jgi:hypothetical protein
MEMILPPMARHGRRRRRLKRLTVRITETLKRLSSARGGQWQVTVMGQWSVVGAILK